MSRPTLIKSQTHEMTGYGVLGYEFRGCSMRYKPFCWLDKDAMMNDCVADYAFEVVF
jgi:hypothetical protein